MARLWWCSSTALPGLVAAAGLLLLSLLLWWNRRQSGRKQRYCRLLFGAGRVSAGKREFGDGTVMTLREESVDPQVLVAEGFLSKEECESVIQEHQHLLSRSTVYADDGSNKNDESRTSSSAYLGGGRPGTVLERIEKRAAELLEVPLEHLETLQLLRYEPSQKYDAHWDYFRNGPDASNNRTKTALVYLNDLEEGDEGGGTRFVKLGLEVRPVAGRVVTWSNCVAEEGLAATAENCDERTLHAGEPPQRSVKYALNIWARNMPAR